MQAIEHVSDLCYPNLSWEVKLVYWLVRMPPKRNNKKPIVNLGIDQEQDDILNNPVQSENRKMVSFFLSSHWISHWFIHQVL